jgi:hypothetical protein
MTKEYCHRISFFSIFLCSTLTLATDVTNAQATYFSEWNKTIGRLGVQGDSYYVDFAEPFGQTCGHGVAYIPPEHKGLYAQLLAAKLSGKKISRFDYEQTGGNGATCTVKLVEIRD